MKLKLKNFRNIDGADVEFGKINILGGGSGSGKSTIKAALAYAYTGVNILKTERVIKDKRDEATAEITDGFLTIERKSKPGGNDVRLNGSKVTNKAMEEELVNKLGLTYQNLVMMFDSSKFLSLSENEQKDYLYQICGMKVTADTIKNYCSAPLTPKAEELLRNVLGDQQIEPTQLDAAYKIFFNERAAKKKELALATNKIEALCGKDSSVDLKDAQQKIEAIDKKTDKLEAEKSKLMVEFGASNERAKQIQDLDATILKHHEEAKALERQIDPNLDFGEAEMDIFGYVQEISKLEEKTKKLVATLNLAKGEVKANREIILKLDTQGCPLTDKLVCTADKGLLKKTLEDAVIAKEEEIAITEKDLNDSETMLNIQKKAKEKLEAQIALDNKKTQALKLKAENEIKRHDIPAVNPTIGQQVTDKETEIAELKTQRKSVSIAVENAATLAELNKSEKSLLEVVEALETLVQELSPKGVKAAILQKVLGKVEDFGNDAIGKMIPDNELHFSYDDGFTINLIDRKMDTNRTSEDLSSGEKLRLSIAFQYIFSNITGCKTIFVDDLNLVDQTIRSSIFQLLKEISPHFDHIYVAITEDDTCILQNYKSELGADKLFFISEGKVIEQ